MGLRDLSIRNSYTGRGSSILRDFLLPSLSESTYYDRITGYYTLESLLAISQGVEELYRRGGKMRLIIGIHSFPKELVEAALQRDYLKKQIESIRIKLRDSICSMEDALQKRRLATLSWMIEDGLLEVKTAAISGGGIFHPKTLILTDNNGDSVAAIGSPNETGNGLGGNFEQLVVLKSWENLDGVEDQQGFFSDLWNNQAEDAIVLDITEETADLIFDSLGPDYKNPFQKYNWIKSRNLISEAASMPANFFVSGEIPALFMHQERAVIDALSRWPVRVLFADEVGLGKTFEAAATLVYLVKYCKVNRAVILTPKSVLQQWQDELYEHFGLNVWLYDSGKKEYISREKHSISMNGKNPLGQSSPELILMSAQYARGAGENCSVFEREGTILPDLLVIDEAHSARVSEDIAGAKKKTRMYRMLEKVSKSIPHLVLATATPMQKSAEEYHAILQLLGLPKAWQKGRAYKRSLKLISTNSEPDISDAASAADLLYSTISVMKPETSRLQEDELKLLSAFESEYDSFDNYDKGAYVVENWSVFRRLFIKLHPARLLTVRNTRRSLTSVGYVFPKRNLIEKNLINSERIQLFYSKVFDFISGDFFSIERALDPERRVNLGFVRVSYQQRVASSLYSCIESLKRRQDYVATMRDYLISRGIVDSPIFTNTVNELIDDIESDEKMLTGDDSQELFADLQDVDIEQLMRAINLESANLGSLIKEAKELLLNGGDLKIIKSIELAIECLGNGDAVLVFSRYTDTISALIHQFVDIKADLEYVYGVYTGKKSVIVKAGVEYPCDKATIKSELFSGDLKIVFCSDAASEGLNLQAARVLINVDVPWTPSRLEQRIGRVARLGQVANEVDIYNVWYPNSIEARMYHRIQKRLEETNLAIGEFPDVVANSIKQAVIEDTDNDEAGINELKEIRNSYQTKALEELWATNGLQITTSKAIRIRMMQMCDEHFSWSHVGNNTSLHEYHMADDESIRLSADEGMDESFSYKSDIWKQWKVTLSKVIVLKDCEGHHSVFSLQNDPRKFIKHENILDIVVEGLKESYVSTDWPKMLPNMNDLDMHYSIDCEVAIKPELWPPKVN